MDSDGPHGGRGGFPGAALEGGKASRKDQRAQEHGGRTEHGTVGKSNSQGQASGWEDRFGGASEDAGGTGVATVSLRAVGCGVLQGALEQYLEG